MLSFSQFPTCMKSIISAKFRVRHNTEKGAFKMHQLSVDAQSSIKNQSIFNIIRWVDGSMGQTTHRPSIDVPSIIYFFIISYRLRALKTLYFHFCKGFCKKLWKKNNTWNIRCLVDELFVPSTHQPSVLYWRLSDFKNLLVSQLNVDNFLVKKVYCYMCIIVSWWDMDCLLWLIVLGQKINKSCVTKDDTLGTTPKLYIRSILNTDINSWQPQWVVAVVKY